MRFKNNGAVKLVSVKFNLKRLLIFLTLACALFNGCKGEQARVHRVHILSGLDNFVDIADGFKRAMTALGYVEGRDIVYIVHRTGDDLEKWRNENRIASERSDLIFAFPTISALEAKRAAQGTKTPVVFALAGIEGNNLVDSLHRPGGNISGVRFPGPEATGKRLEILREFMPGARRVLITYDPDYPTIPEALEELKSTASLLDVTLIKEPVKNIRELDALLRKRDASNNIDFDAILIMPEALTQSPDCWALITQFAAEHRLPIAGALCQTANEGALFAYAPDLSEIGMLAASIADKIFKGVPAGEIMVITPKSRLWLNYRVAEKLGLKVSTGLLCRADRIIR